MNHRTSCLVIAALCSSACGGAPSPGGAQGGSQSAVPADYLKTPFGLMHKDCVHPVESGATVRGDGAVLHKDGRLEVKQTCPHKRLGKNGGAPPTTSGWVQSSDWTSQSWIRKIVAGWTVPSAPTNNGGLLYYFPGLEPTNGANILQPVLQYGYGAAPGGYFWEFMSWFCCPGGNNYYSTPIQVSTGDSLQGSIEGSSCDASGVCSWAVVSADTSTGTTSQLNVTNSPSTYNWAFGGVGEYYGVATCDEYPASNPLVFGNIALYDGNLNPLSPSWNSSVDSSVTPQCNYGVNTTPSTTTLNYSNDAGQAGRAAK
jgi:hypothetical protein